MAFPLSQSDKFKELSSRMSEPFKLIGDLKSQGHKMAGVLCTYVPEEVIMAGGFSPIRLVTGASNSTSQMHKLHANYCSYAKSCAAAAIEGKFGDLDALIGATSCVPKIRLFEAWNYYKPTPFNFIVDTPRTMSEKGFELYRDELVDLFGKLKEQSKVEAGDAELKDAIQKVNKLREVLRKFAALRQEDNIVLGGSEMHTITLAAQTLPKDEAIETLNEILDEAKSMEGKKPAKRLIFSGSIAETNQIYDMIETNCQAAIVADDECIGSRYYEGPVNLDDGASPIDAIANRYLSGRMPCSRDFGVEKRIDNIKQLYKDYRADGVLHFSLKFCDLYQYDAPVIRRALIEAEIPLNLIEVDDPSGGLGPERTRLEAFLEML